MLEISNVSKKFGPKTAVNALSLRVNRGQVFGLLGLNGAGKSTTIRMILGILKPDSGTILWDGKPTGDQVRGKFGYLPEERGLYQQMRVIPHLVLLGRLHGMERKAAERAARRWLDRFQITDHAESVIGTLSKGNQQKVQFIGAILHNPEFVVLDEPFTGLDPVNTGLFKDVFQELVKEEKTILFSSHRLDHVEELSDAVCIIHKSTAVLTGRVEDILAEEAPKWVLCGGDLPAIEAVLHKGCPCERHGHLLKIPASAPEVEGLLQRLVAAGVQITHFEYVRPTLEDIFLREVGSFG